MITAEMILNALGYGEKHAKTRTQLCCELCTNDRNVRKAIEDARREETAEGPFIVTTYNGTGYFLTHDADVVERHYRGERARALSIFARTKGEHKFLKKAGRL